MSGYPAVYNPVVANPNDGENITLCKILDAVSTGSGGGIASANAAVGPDGVTRVPLNLNADGELKVNVDASVDADLSAIENKLDTLIGIATPQAADVASINTEAQSIDNKLPALSSGRVPVVNETPATNSTYGPQAGVIPINTILVGPINVSQFRTMSVQVASLGTSGAIAAEISNDNATWTQIGSQGVTNNPVYFTTITTAGSYYCQTWGANYFRLRLSTATTAGTTTLFVQGVKEVYPQNLQSVSGTVTANIGSIAASSSTGFNSFFTLISAASTNATSIKASSGTIGSLWVQVGIGRTCYVKIFNKSSAPVVGTDTPVLNIPVTNGATDSLNCSFAGLRLSNGIAIAITQGQALLDNTPVSAGDAVINLAYV